MNLKKAIKSFEKYVQEYDLSEDNIKRKYHHSYRVMKLSKEIAQSMNLSKEQTELAELIGLLHDIARFKQWTTFKTYIEIGVYNNKSGCMSYNILKEKEELLEGVNLINLKYPNYDPDKLYDTKKEEYYSLEMILNSLKEFEGLENEFYKIIFFDFMIGNTDRHQSNWGVIKEEEKIVGIAPIYDNGSSLCAYIKEENIDSYLGKDKLKFKSLVDTKSTSRIRIDKKKRKEPTHLEMIKHIKGNNEEIFIENLNRINSKLTEDVIDNIINNMKEITLKRKKLIKKYITTKKEIINKI